MWHVGFEVPQPGIEPTLPAVEAQSLPEKFHAILFKIFKTPVFYPIPCQFSLS